MIVDDAYASICRALPYEPGAFYGGTSDLGLGAGLLYANVRQPAFDSERRLYRTIRGLAYVITHECDTEQENDRPFIDSVLICPIIRFEEFVDEGGISNLLGFLGDVAQRRVPRLAYLPTASQLPYGGLLYLNRITSTHISAFDEAGTACIAAVSAIGLREIDVALQNLLLREKSDVLWGMQ